jgi:hypothetical protein
MGKHDDESKPAPKNASGEPEHRDRPKATEPPNQSGNWHSVVEEDGQGEKGGGHSGWGKGPTGS